MKTISMVLAIAILVTVPLVASADDAMVVDLVNKAATLWKDKGKDYACKVINASAGPLRKGSLYVIACDFSGQFLAHPAQQDLRGQDEWELQDAKGKFITQEFIKVAKSKEGQGWYEYDWVRVNETKPTKKRTFIRRIPGEDALVASGYYMK
jgi:signal transduction histidine kinase